MRRASHTGSGSLALALLVATVSSLAGGGAGTADAAFPGQNGRLVYFYEREIWTANADGSDAMQLTASRGSTARRAGRPTARGSPLRANAAACRRSSS